MQARLTTKPEQEVITAIQGLDLESVKLRVMDPELGEGWTQEYADSIEAAYKNYLTMLVKYPDDAEDILLSKDVDEFWHTHILQTRKYAEDCQIVFGNFLHHEPHVGEVTAKDIERREAQAAKTRILYQREFADTQNYEAAWSGMPGNMDSAAFSGASIKTEKAAFSGAAIRTEKAAFSGASIRGEKAAFSGASIKSAGAAFSGASIRAEKAAFSGASIKSANAAFSGASISAEKAAFSGASLKAVNAAFSGASIAAQEAAFSGASIRKENTTRIAASESRLSVG